MWSIGILIARWATLRACQLLETAAIHGRLRRPAGATIDDDDHDPQPLFRLRYLGSPHDWGFAIYLASKDGYEDSSLPAGHFTGSAAEALDCACRQQRLAQHQHLGLQRLHLGWTVVGEHHRPR